MNARTDPDAFWQPPGLSLEDLIVEAAEAARPPERLTVTEAAEKYMKLNNPGAYVGDYNVDRTPYLREFMDTFTSTDFTAACFVGPAQTGKTEAVNGWIAYSAICDPADMMIVQTSQPVARDFSIRRIDRLNRNSPEVGARLLNSRDADNKFDKSYRGMLLTLSWPTINELSGKPIPRLWLTDYDRMTQDVDGEGDPFSLARKRATSFKAFGMTVVESTPGFPVKDARYTPTTRHEAVPTSAGIIPIYNSGDRRRWYWRCHSCNHAFEPDFELLRWPDTADEMEAAEAALLHCPHCDQAYHHDAGVSGPSKFEMNLNHARWLKDGEIWTPSGEIVGNARRSDIASFWMKGVVAAFTDWKTLVYRYLQAEKTYEQTGSEEALKTTVNTDQGKPYIPKLLASARSPEALMGRAKGSWLGTVPPGVRFLIATIDIQKNSFVVQVHGIHPDGDISIIDRFDIKKSKRLDEDGEHLWVNPASFPEDWKLIGEEVLGKSYPLADESGRRMSIFYVTSDSGGREGVTSNAYAFYRWLRDGPQEDDPDAATYDWQPSYAGKFMLLKGSSSQTAPRVNVTFPDSQRKDRFAGARGEIPVAVINVHTLKDTLNNRLDRDTPGGRVNFPSGLSSNFFTELTVEVKDPVKGWINPNNYRNESWDLIAYCLGALQYPQIAFDTISWNDEPLWAAEWDRNILVFDPVGEKPFDAKPRQSYGLSQLAENLA